MTQTDCIAPPALESTEQDMLRPIFGPRRQARIRRVFDGVVASYIHEISVRNGSAHRAEPSTV